MAPAAPPLPLLCPGFCWKNGEKGDCEPSAGVRGAQETPAEPAQPGAACAQLWKHLEEPNRG